MTLNLNALQTLLIPLQPWLVVLNCCQGAAAGEQIPSLAYSVASSSAAAVLGMRQNMPSIAADRFADALFAGLLRYLPGQLTAGAADALVDWGKVLGAGRTALVEEYGNDAGNTSEWTLPVLYTWPGEFRVQVVSTGQQPGPAGPVGQPGPPAQPDPAQALNESRVAAAIIEGLVNRLGPDTPPAVLAALGQLAAQQHAEAAGTPGGQG